LFFSQNDQKEWWIQVDLMSVKLPTPEKTGGAVVFFVQKNGEVDRFNKG